MHYYILFIFFATYYLFPGQSEVMDMELVKFEPVHVNSKYIILHCNEMQRKSRGVFAINVNMTLVIDIPEASLFDVKVYRSALGNNQYILTPIVLSNKTLVELMNKYYKNYLMADLSKYSNWPTFEGEWKGSLPQGYYWIKNYIYDTTNVSGATKLGKGTYKIVFVCYSDGEVVYNIEVVIRILNN